MTTMINKPATQKELAQLLDELPAIIDVWHDERPCAAAILGIGKEAAYQAAHDGTFGAFRAGRFWKVPTYRLRQLLLGE